MREWNAAVYHRVSNPQMEWGLPVLARLPLEGGELVLDVGCGTGRLTERLLARLPRGRVVAIDQSANMLEAAREYLTGKGGRGIDLVQADASALPFAEHADAVFSTATFHWIRDHVRLFASLYTALKPGGRLVAQCGGAGNLERMHHRCRTLTREPGFARYFDGWSDAWEFADAATTEARLRRAGFVDIHTDIEAAPIVQPDAAAFREFSEHVICRPFLARIDVPEVRDRFMSELTEAASRDSPPFELDYWRLNIDARQPL
jgi:trans-aconitate 2-methyltransferase